MPPRKSPADKKGLFHLELMEMGEVTVLVKSDVMPSKYGDDKPPYIILEIDGKERYYTLDSEACETFFDQQKGQTLTIQAVGGRGDKAAIDLIDEGGEAPPQQPPPRSAPQQSRPAPQQRQQPPAQQQASAQHQHALPPKPDTTKSLLFARRHVARSLVLQKLTLRAAMALAEDWKAYNGSDMPLDLFQSINASLFISAERAMVKASVTQSFYEDGMPTNIDFDTLKEPEAGQQPPPPPTKPKPVTKPQPRQEAPPPTQPEPAEPEDASVPF